MEMLDIKEKASMIRSKLYKGTIELLGPDGVEIVQTHTFEVC